VIDLLAQTEPQRSRRRTPAPRTAHRRRRRRRRRELPPAFGQPSSAIHTIAIDPGTAATTPAQGRRRREEKDLTLASRAASKGVIEARLGSACC
jgi:N-acetylmuramoyl-L-alanine amidase